ncbi:uncharacterized protein [Physcomitrium patens]|uniref:DUF3727 domain-containing protein n=1 Tax=Physcomitrium patens TaxID=3218 RepID=A0A2K1KWW9_PHYPA|nr:uncharacterized protein LOC112279266 [Physcomitrium patens]PNR58285.1 hypothetical protein PHYPA_005280 [Physcomitrium patens]|eukprot:XP_024369293.1 uncharacterized protein LOC112279266 [Physcomitrella patens]
MAASRCVGFALPLQTGGAGWRRNIELQAGRRSGWAGDNLFLQLGLRRHGCVCLAAANYDSGYKRSSPKRSESKKTDKYGSVAEVSDSGRQTRKPSRGQKNEKKIAINVDEINTPPMPLLKPLAGFVLDDTGKVVVMAPPQNRTVTIVDPVTKRPLECIIRRAFSSSTGEQCFLLLPLDMPLQILKIEEEREGLIELSDAELNEVLPSAAYALAKSRLHLIVSGFCLTARGGFCYTEKDVIDLNTEYGEGLGGSLAEGVEVATFQMDNNQYLMYTPFDPLMFVAHKDSVTGELKIADDDLLDDEAVLDAIDEENEFQALVDEEEAVNEALKTAK